MGQRYDCSLSTGYEIQACPSKYNVAILKADNALSWMDSLRPIRDTPTFLGWYLGMVCFPQYPDFMFCLAFAGLLLMQLVAIATSNVAQATIAVLQSSYAAK